MNSPLPWHTLDHLEVLQKLAVTPGGLPSTEAADRLAQHGPNELIERGLKSPWAILWEQLTSVMVLVLIGAAIIALILRDYIDAVAILAIVVLNAALGLAQEYRAEKAMAALKRLAAPSVRVRRDGRVMDIPARDLVPGDILLLEAGNAIPADARLIENANLRVQEAALTGESLPVDKTLKPLPGADLPLGDRRNMLYFGTAVAYGRGAAVVVATGMRTELGRIAELIQAVGSEKTPLQKRMTQLGQALAVAVAVIVTVVFALGVARGEDLREMFLIAISMAVAAIPEGLPAVLTITLALGAQRMLKRHALIRKLPAVETLGSVTVICSDKTGTLTENRMTVTMLDVAGHTVDLTETVRRGKPTLARTAEPLTLMSPEQELLLIGGALCNDAWLEPMPERADEMRAVGDPTEGALIVAGARFGLWKTDLETRLPRVAEVPFSSERKRMTTIHQLSASAALPLLDATSPYLAFTKGGVDNLLEVSAQVLVNGERLPLTPAFRARIEEATNRLAREGLRVLGVAFSQLATLPADGVTESIERELTFVGLVGMIDPPRPEVRAAVATAKQAGIRPVMITGDHPLTALAIARELGMVEDSHARLLTGQEVGQLTPAELAQAVTNVSVYARVSPEHKLSIVQALRAQGQVVAMTGDGVNDAPALRQSDIGVAMGITGTDVSKEAADMVILDDNFATIVHAVEEGRAIYDNARKFVKYILTSNTGEIAAMFLAQLAGLPLPLTTLQILWMNLVTDGLPALALGVEKGEADAMRRRPYAPEESIFSRGLGRHMFTIGPFMGLVSFLLGYWGWATNHPGWQTMVFTTLTLSQMFHALAVRSNSVSLFKQGLFSNKPLLGAVLLTTALQLALLYVPLLQGWFHTQPLAAPELLLCLAASATVLVAVEIEKWFIRRNTRVAISLLKNANGGL